MVSLSAQRRCVFVHVNMCVFGQEVTLVQIKCTVKGRSLISAVEPTALFQNFMLKLTAQRRVRLVFTELKLVVSLQKCLNPELLSRLCAE